MLSSRPLCKEAAVPAIMNHKECERVCEVQQSKHHHQHPSFITHTCIHINPMISQALIKKHTALFISVNVT